LQGNATLPEYAASYKWYGSPKNQGQAQYPIHEKPAYPTGCGINPWCAPGSSPVFDPCGVAGGDEHEGIPGAGGSPPPGHQQGEDGRDLPELPTKTVWRAGSVVEVSWAVIANHAGGYQYRLCKKPSNDRPSEECFQQTPIAFHGDHQYINFCANNEQIPPYNPKPSAFPKCDPNNRTKIPAVDVSTGTIPAGSTWRRNPIPPCKTPNGGAYGEQCGPKNGTDSDDYQFSPAGVDITRKGQLLGGFGAGGCYGAPYGVGCGQPPYGNRWDGLWAHEFHFNIVDQLEVPKVPAGEYIMSFRWDCEQTAQIWSTCTDITITTGTEDVVV